MSNDVTILRPGDAFEVYEDFQVFSFFPGHGASKTGEVKRIIYAQPGDNIVYLGTPVFTTGKGVDLYHFILIKTSLNEDLDLDETVEFSKSADKSLYGLDEINMYNQSIIHFWLSNIRGMLAGIGYDVE